MKEDLEQLIERWEEYIELCRLDQNQEPKEEWINGVIHAYTVAVDQLRTVIAKNGTQIQSKKSSANK